MTDKDDEVTVGATCGWRGGPERRKDEPDIVPGGSAHMMGMETTAPVSTDLEAVTDLVLNRQLIDVQRDHAKGIVKMVLECAAEAAGPVEPAYKPSMRRINGTIRQIFAIEVGRGYCDAVVYGTGWDGTRERRNTAYTPPRNDLAETRLTEELTALIGHDVALWVTDDEFFTMPTVVQFNDLGVSGKG